MASDSNPYDDLGLLPGSSQADIKRRYRQLAKQHHPDRNTDTAAAEAKLRRINAAYRLLSDPATRRTYDRSFDAVFNPLRPPVPDFEARRRSFVTVAGLALLLLLSTAFGVLLRTDTGTPALSGLLSPFSLASFSKKDAPERPAPDYSFVPSHGTFDDQSAPSQDTSSSATPSTDDPGMKKPPTNAAP